MDLEISSLAEAGWKPPKRRMRGREELPDPVSDPTSEINRKKKMVGLRLDPDNIQRVEDLSEYYGLTKTQYVQVMLERVITADSAEVRKYVNQALSTLQLKSDKIYVSSESSRFAFVGAKFVFSLDISGKDHGELINAALEKTPKIYVDKWIKEARKRKSDIKESALHDLINAAGSGRKSGKQET